MRRFRAVVLLASLAFALSAVAWHHDHGLPFPAETRPAGADVDGDRAHAHQVPGANRADRCPVCLSQRVLGQSCFERLPEAGSPGEHAFAVLPSPEPLALVPIRARAARAPPRA